MVKTQIFLPDVLHTINDYNERYSYKILVNILKTRGSQEPVIAHLDYSWEDI